MKLLLDQNLPRRLTAELLPSFPGSGHVRDFGLERATDNEIYTFAAKGGFCIVTKDVDFRDLVAVNGFPPKVVLIRFGNVPNAALSRRLLGEVEAIEEFLARDDAGTLELV